MRKNILLKAIILSFVSPFAIAAMHEKPERPMTFVEVMQKATEACSNHNTEEPCGFAIKDREVKGTCKVFPKDGALVCKPERSEIEGQERRERKSHQRGHEHKPKEVGHKHPEKIITQ